MSDTQTKDYVVEPTSAKKAVAGDLAEKLGRSTGAIMLDYRGLSVAEMTDLRRKLGDTDAEFHVVKNTLLRIAAEANDQDFGNLLEGPSAVAILFGDPAASAKVFTDFLATHRNVTLKGGVLRGRPLESKQVEALGKIPPKEVLLAQLLAGFNGPISGFVGTLSGVLSNFVFTVQAIADQKGGAEA
jgi:large subunit ribosomal protein L10